VPAFPEDIPSFLKESKKVLFAKGVDPEKLMSLANKLISIYEKIINHAEKNGITLVFGGNATKSSIMGMTAVSTSNLATKVMRQYISLMKTPTDDYQEKK